MAELQVYSLKHSIPRQGYVEKAALIPQKEYGTREGAKKKSRGNEHHSKSETFCQGQA
jgi:hypothetical protein